MEKNKHRKQKLWIVIILLLLVLFLLIISIGYLFRHTKYNKNYFGVIDQSTLEKVKLDEIPQDALYISQDRKLYVDGSMRLVIPRIELDTTIGADTIPEALEEKPGLYEFSQMPSMKNVNVSIAGHRDIGHEEFYFLDQMQDGDNLYLIYQDMVYQYQFFESKIIASTDWSVIQRQGFSALTLTTCEPIGTRLKRLVVVGKLVDIYPVQDQMEFV